MSVFSLKPPDTGSIPSYNVGMEHPLILPWIDSKDYIGVLTAAGEYYFQQLREIDLNNNTIIMQSIYCIMSALNCSS